MTDPTGELTLYTDPNGTTRLHVRLVDGTVWLSQGLMASLYGKDVRTISEHLRNIYEEAELEPEATIRNFRIVQIDGSRYVSRELGHRWQQAVRIIPPVSFSTRDRIHLRVHVRTGQTSRKLERGCRCSTGQVSGDEPKV